MVDSDFFMVKQVTRVKSTFVKAKTGVTLGHRVPRLRDSALAASRAAYAAGQA